jgi:hypothetical protein
MCSISNNSFIIQIPWANHSKVQEIKFIFLPLAKNCSLEQEMFLVFIYINKIVSKTPEELREEQPLKVFMKLPKLED